MIYEEIYNELVSPSVKLIKQRYFDEAYSLYKQKSLELEETFLIN